jgi:hypothetical protein
MGGQGERPNPQDDRNFIPTPNNERLESHGNEMWLFQLINGFLEEPPRVSIVNEKPSVLDPDIAIEKGVSRNVQVDNKSVPVESDRR